MRNTTEGVILQSVLLVSIVAGLPTRVAAQNIESSRADIRPLLERARLVHSYWKANTVFPDREKHVRLYSAALPGRPSLQPQGCCTAWRGFNFTGVLMIAPTDRFALTCTYCVPGFTGPSIGTLFPWWLALRDDYYSTIMTWESRIAGPCTATFLWFRPPYQQPLQGYQSSIADCGSNNQWFVEFFNFKVPDVPAGVGVVVGIIEASDGTTDIDFEHFEYNQ